MAKHLNQIPDDSGYSFVHEAIKEEAAKSGTTVTGVAAALGQTALTYARKYISGEVDLRTSNLCVLCNRFDWNPLSFFAFEGHRFTTPLRYVYLMECAGLKLDEMLKEKGIEINIGPALRYNASSPRTRVEKPVSYPAQPEPKPAEPAQNPIMESHWQMIAQSQQQVIESQKDLITMLRTELAKANSSRTYFGSVADDAKPGEGK